MVTSLGFKYEFLIESVSTILSMLTDQLLSIFFMKDESVINFLRNHPANNIPLLIDLITDYIHDHYAGNVIPSKKTIQQAIDITISQLRCYQQPYEYKKYIIFSDFTNFGYSGFQTFDLWDTQGYTFSLNGIYIGSWKLNGYETFKLIADPQVIQDYMQNMNGELYDVNLLNRYGEKIDLNQFRFNKTPEPIIPSTRISVGEYLVKYPIELLQMRIKEGFKEDSPLTVSIKVNFQIKLIYQIQNQNVNIFYERVTPMERIPSHQKKVSDLDNDLSINIKRLFEVYKQRDYLQEIVLEMRAKNISIDEAMTQLVKNKAFENQKFVNRNFKQISLVFLIRAINFRQYQEEGEEFNKSQFYFYIRQKVQEVATKSMQNCLLYQQGQDFMIIRIIWHSHTILRLICIYENADMLPVVQSRIKEVFKSNQILRNSLIQFDHSFKNLLISSETHQLKKNPDICMMESCWEWPKSLIWDMQQMYRILASLRVKSNYLRVPAEGDRTNKFFVAQLDLEKQKTVVVQNLILLDDRIICNVFAENLITNVRQVLFEYFQKIQDHERQIIISLHTAHSMYRWSLIKKKNDEKRKGPDFFTLQFVTRQGKQYQYRDKIVEAFIQYADSQALQYPAPTSNLNYDCLLTKAYNYQEIKQKYIQDSRAKLNQGYLQVLQTIADHSVLRKQSNIDKDLFFLAIAPQRLLMIVFTDENTIFYLICLEQIERNHNSHLFLNEMQEKKIDQLIGYVLQEYNAAFAKEVHQLYLNNIPNSYLVQAIQGCQVQNVEFDLYEVCSIIKQLMEQRKQLKKSLIYEESPGKQQRKALLAPPSQIKQDFVKDCCKIWDDRLRKLMSESKISMKLISKNWYYYDKQDKQQDKQDKSEKIMNILFMSQQLREGDQEFENMIQLLDYQRIKQKKTRIVISFSVYYYEARSLSKMLNTDCDCPALIQVEEPTSVTTKIQRWTDPFFKYNHQFMNKFELEMHRLLSVNKENIEVIVSLVEAMDNKVVEMNQQDRKFDQFFSIQFSEEMKNTEIQNTLFRFMAISEEYYIFIMNQDNIELFNQSEFKTEREYLKDEPYVIPFWVIVQIKVNEEKNEGQFRMITYTEQYQESISKIIVQLKKLIEDTIATTHLYLIIKKVSESNHRDRIKLVLKPKYDLEADQKNNQEFGNDNAVQLSREMVKESAKLPTQQIQPQNQLFEQRKLRKQNTMIVSQIQERKEYQIPHVELRVFHTYQSKLQYLINNTILMNQQIEENQYCWYLDKQVYLFMFQTSKNILSYADKYPELREGAMPGCLTIIMNVYSTSKNQAKIKQDIDYFSEHIKQKMDEETINALAQGILRNPRLKEQEYNQIQQGEHCFIEILLNSEIQDMLAFSVLMRHNLEKTFLKYEVQMQEKKKLEVQKDDARFIVDQHENSFIFSKYKVVHSPNVHLSSFFGQGLCLLNFQYQVDSETVTSYVFPKQPRCVQQQDILKIPSCQPIIQLTKGKYINKPEMSYDITKSYSEKFLIIDITYRGELKWDAFKQYFQVLVRQVELEYSLECLLQKNYKFSDIESIFRQLNEYSFKLHHFVYPLHYEEILWKSTKNWIRQKIVAEIEKKGIPQPTLQQFETQQIMDGPILGYRPLIYSIHDNPDSDAIDSIKHYATQKLKKNDHDPADLYHRSILIYIKVSNTLEVFLYNVNWDMAASLNHQFGVLSRWSIIRNLVAQKIKNDLCACYNIRLSPLFEEIFLAKHNIYQHSIVNDLHRLRSQEQPVSKQKQAQRKEGQQDQFPTVSKAIECLVVNEFPHVEYQLFEFVKHLDQFFKLNLCMVKPKKLTINSTEGEGDFLQREGKAYLELLKDFYKNVIQMQLILYVKKLQLKNLSQIPQSKAILDKVLNQSTCIYTNVFPLFLFRLKDKPGLKGSLDLEKEYYALITEAYQRMIKQKDFDIFFGDDVIMEDQFNDEDIMKKNNIFMSEDDFKSLIQPIDIHVYFSEAMIKEANMQVQNTDVYRRVNYLRHRNNPSLIKVVTLITFKYLFIFEKLYSLPGTEVPKLKEDSPFEEIEKYHSELIDQDWKKNEKQLNMYLLFHGYSKIYQQYNKTYPKCESIQYKINVGFVLDWIKLEDFTKFIRINSQIYYLHKVHNFYTYEAPNLISKAEQLQVQLYLGLLGQNDKHESQKIIELELDEQQQGSQQLTIIVYLLINSEHANQFLGVFENSIIETLKRAHKNFMAYSWWNKIKTSSQLSGQDLGFLIQYCQQIQTKKLAKEIKFEQLDDSYRQKQFAIDQFISRIHFPWCIVGNKKALIIVNATQDVLYIVDFQENMIENIRILYMIIDNPQYDQERMIKPHFDECTQLIKKFIDEMI